MSSSQTRDDIWAEIASQRDEDGEGGGGQGLQPPKPRIDVVYGRRRAPDSIASKGEPVRSSSRRYSRVSFAPIKRTSWNRSLSIRGRESIVVAPGVNLRPPPRQRGPRIPKPAPRPKKGKQEQADFTKEKAYFEDVDSFDLVEESPSPKHFNTWAMGANQDLFIHDLPAIMERWRISKLTYRSESSQLFKIIETPLVDSQHSSCNGSNNLSDKTTERVLMSGVPFSLTCDEDSIVSRPESNQTMRALDENSILTSLDALSIKDDKVEKISSQAVQHSKQSIVSEGSRVFQEDSSTYPLTSTNGEHLSAFDQLLLACHLSAPVRLSEVFYKYCDMSSIKKIGEGTYGEAFKAGETVCKVVPIDGDLFVNGEVQKKSEEVLEEVLLSLTLNGLRGTHTEANNENSCTCFIETKDFQVCQGAYDADLIRAWEEWDTKRGSENDHPKEFPDKQCYIVFVLEDGGKDLESFVLLNYDEARSLLLQVTVALAVAEASCEFEHRDLHWGNILLTRDETAEINFTHKGKKKIANTFGLTVSIIDFTLSRINTGKTIFFLDLSTDPGLFEGPKGDKQSEIYRKMREVTEDCWEGSFPRTNVLWLIYLVDLLLTKKSFKRTSKEERDLRSLKKRLNTYDSSSIALVDNFFSDLLFDCDI